MIANEITKNKKYLLPSSSEMSIGHLNACRTRMKRCLIDHLGDAMPLMCQDLKEKNM